MFGVFYWNKIHSIFGKIFFIKNIFVYLENNIAIMEKKRIVKYTVVENVIPSLAKEPTDAPVQYTQSYIDSLANMSPFDISNSAISGFALEDIQEELHLSASIVGDILGISKSKYYELLKSDDIGTRNIDALADFANIWKKGLEAFDGNQKLLNEWMELKNRNLGMVKPIDLLSSRIGRRELEKAFQRIEYSLYG